MENHSLPKNSKIDVIRIWGLAMAVMRVQSIKVNSLKSALKHRLSPPSHESLVYSGLTYEGNEEFLKLFNAFSSVCEDKLKVYKEFFQLVESKGYKHKIRKNSTVQEIVIAYSSDDFVSELGVLREIKSDVETLNDIFKEKFGFTPFGAVFVHADENGRYHVHYVFSLMSPSLTKKVRWNSKIYFEIAKEMSKRSKRIKISERKKSGNYPLWLIRAFEGVIGRLKTKELVKKAREKGLKAVDLVDLLRELRKVSGGDVETIVDEYLRKRAMSEAFERKAQKPTEGSRYEERERAIRVLRLFMSKAEEKRKKREGRGLKL